MNNQKNNYSQGDYQIHLNFLPIKEPLPCFTIFRKRCSSDTEQRPFNDVKHYRLPEKPGDECEWLSYWISMLPKDGYEKYTVEPSINRHLTCWVLYYVLQKSAEKQLNPEHFNVLENHFRPIISFIQKPYEEGNEQLEVEPYYLKATEQFGYLVDFHFKLNSGVLFSREIQRLSLSLNNSFKRNINYYIDRNKKLETFIEKRENVFSTLTMPGTDKRLEIDFKFVPLPADRLKAKTYIFDNDRDSYNQFMGLQAHGPLKPLDDSLKLLFIFQEQDREAARLLARGLQGSSKYLRNNFPGFKSLFKCDLIFDSNPIVLSSMDEVKSSKTIERVKAERDKCSNIIPIVILPSDSNVYHAHKAMFAQEDIPTQVCTIDVLQNQESLKWALSNIALQIFCKAGGYPWKVRPAEKENTLIIGISQSHQSHKLDNRIKVKKYFAFSVLTDSSGLFQSIQVLGESKKKEDYLSKLRENLRNILEQNSERFERVVIHTSFKHRYREIEAIESTVQDASKLNCQFAVVKVNHKPRFFGINRGVNSLVPYEATQVQLGDGEYLVWFEGISPKVATVSKVFPGPTHLKISHINSSNKIIPDSVLIQDLVNLSGANWRGFNAKSSPVSVLYCQLLADMIGNFHEHKLPLPTIKNIRPWFL